MISASDRRWVVRALYGRRKRYEPQAIACALDGLHYIRAAGVTDVVQNGAGNYITRQWPPGLTMAALQMVQDEGDALDSLAARARSAPWLAEWTGIGLTRLRRLCRAMYDDGLVDHIRVDGHPGWAISGVGIAYLAAPIGIARDEVTVARG